MIIDDNYIKNQVSLYKETLDINILDKIQNHLSSYIYHYPRKVFRADHDNAIEFYIYYIERLERKIISYTPSEVRFITYFTHTLRNAYINFINRKINKNKYNFREVSLDSTIYEGNEEYTLYEKVAALNKKSNKNSIAKISSKLSKRYKKPDELVFKMHYLELFFTVIIPSLMNYFKINFDDAYRMCESARLTYLEKYNLITKLQDGLTLITSKIKKAQENNDEKKLLSLRNKKMKQLKRLNSIRIVVPYKVLSNIFNLSENIITKIIIKIRNTMKTVLEDKKN